MAEPSSTNKAVSKLESSLKDILIKICETEQRSKLLSTLLRMQLLTREVKSFSRKQLLGSRGLRSKIFKTGKQRMLSKLFDSRRIETKLRKERDKLRSELESMVTKSEYLRIWKKLRNKIQRIRTEIKKKNSDKIEGYLAEKSQEDLEELYILR